VSGDVRTVACVMSVLHNLGIGDHEPSGCTAHGSSGLMNPQYVPASGVVGHAVPELVVAVPVDQF